MKHEFHPGQRWISNTESELGLGLVRAIEGRHVRVDFPAADETRVYALDNAPLNRVHFPVGEQVRHHAGWSMTVSGHDLLNGCTVYLGQTADGEIVQMLEQELDAAAQFNLPEERLFAGQIDPPSRFSLRIETIQHQRRQQQSHSFGLLGARVQLLPHQFYIADQVSQRHAPRVLLADEVGLGKTIEAGLILHQQLVTGRISRVLIVVPESLLHQWLVEMLRRFNLRFSLLDAERCVDLSGESDDNPFDAVQLALCSIEFLTSSEKYQQQAHQSQWDILVVDEAHHLEWSEDSVSQAYQCIADLSAQIPGLLLLTATPEQLGAESHFARLRLLDPDRFFDRDEFVAEQASYVGISALVDQLQAHDKLEGVQQDQQLCRLLEKHLGEGWLKEAESVHDEDAAHLAVEYLVECLLDRHGTGRVLFRNTRDAIQGFPQRQWHGYALPTPDEYLKADSSEIESRLYPEWIWGEDWLDHDPRVEWLLEWLPSHRQDKVLLICAKADTAIELEQWIERKTGWRTSVFHEGLSLVARDRAAAYFADSEQGAQLLVCSEIGSEGRNFQFAHHLVLFDLPLNPDLLEQRIGRLDRIGQTETIHIHTPFYDQGALNKLVRWYHEGLHAFTHVCPMGSILFDEFADSLKQALCSDETDGFQALVESARQRRDQLSDELQQGRDRLLELNSCRPNKAARIVENLQEATRPLELSGYMERLFDHYGVEQQFHSTDAIVIKPTESMLTDQFPGLPEDGLTATYRRSLALQREDMTFLTWEHPLVTEVMDRVMNEGFGNATFCTLKLSPLPPGLIIVEVLLDMHCPAPNALQLHRYLPGTCGRVVVCSNGMDLSEILKDEHISSRAERVKKRVAQDVIQHARPKIQELIERAKHLAEPWFITAMDEARAAMDSDLQQQQARLDALAKVNPMIRQSEIDQVKARQTNCREHLEKASLKLDAIRVMLTTE